MAKDTDIGLRNQVIYSVYVRNYSREGTFKAVERDLDRIGRLGVDIIWLLPIHPVGEKRRKGRLGSPYAIRDYRKINPEFGTMEDFRSLVEAIHRHGMKCMIDVVYNHTSPDSWLAQNHPEYFWHDPAGRMGNRAGGWEDVVDLDYANRDLWEYQIDTLKMWAEIVDGFRCDVAPLVPLDFWLRARREVSRVNPGCLWLSESVEPEFILDLRAKGMTALSDSEIFQAFDMCYDYDIFRYFHDYLSGKCSLAAYAEHVNMQEYIYPQNYVKLRCLENHDQPRAKAVIPDETDLISWTALSYFQKGITLIYAGQETENTARPSLFEKDPVDWNTGHDLSLLLPRLAAIKKDPLFADGSYRLKALDGSTLLAAHVSGSRKFLGVFRFGGGNAGVRLELPDGVYRNAIDGSDVKITGGLLQNVPFPVFLDVGTAESRRETHLCASGE